MKASKFLKTDMPGTLVEVLHITNNAPAPWIGIHWFAGEREIPATQNDWFSWAKELDRIKGRDFDEYESPSVAKVGKCYGDYYLIRLVDDVPADPSWGERAP